MIAEGTRSTAAALRALGTLQLSWDEVPLELPDGRPARTLLLWLALHPGTHDRAAVAAALWPDVRDDSARTSLRAALAALRRWLGDDHARVLLAGRQSVGLLPGSLSVDVLDVEALLATGDGHAAALHYPGPLLPGQTEEWVLARRAALHDRLLGALGTAVARATATGDRAGALELARRRATLDPLSEHAARDLIELLAGDGDRAAALAAYERLAQRLRTDLRAAPSPSTRALAERLRDGTAGLALEPLVPADGAAGMAPPAGAHDAAPGGGAHPAAHEARGRRAASPVRAGGPAAPGGPDAGAQAAPGGPAASRLGGGLRVRARTAFVGREALLHRLRGEWVAAQTGELRVVVLNGEAGIGKTRLVTELVHGVADQGARVLYGRCSEEPLLNYEPWVEALEPALREVPVSVLERVLPDGGADLRRVFGDVERRLGAGRDPHPPSGDTDGERFRFLQAIGALTTGLAADAGLLLVLDDLQWADAASRVALRHLARWPEAPVLVVATVRDEAADGHGDLEATLGEIRRLRPVLRLALRGLDDAAVQALVADWAGGPPPEGLAAAVREATNGNPLFVEELLEHLVETGTLERRGTTLALTAPLDRLGVPAGVRAVLDRRLERLSARTRDVLRLAALLDDPVDVARLERLADEPASLLSDLDEAVAAGLLLSVPGQAGRVQFSHALVREALDGELPPGRRLELHRLVLRVLEAEPRVDPAQLARHARAGGSPEAALRHEIAAARQATAELAYERALPYYDTALAGAAGDPALVLTLLLEQGDALWSAQEIARSREAFVQAADLAQELRDPEALGRAALGYGGRTAGFAIGVVDPTLVDLLERALTLGGPAPLLLARLAEALAFAGDDRPHVLAAQAEALAREQGDPATLALVLQMGVYATWGPDGIAGRLGKMRELMALAREAGETMTAAQGYAWTMNLIMQLGDGDALQAELASRQRNARYRQHAYDRWLATANDGLIALLEGRLEESERLALRAADLGREAENSNAAQIMGLTLIFLRSEQGRGREIVDLVTGAVAAEHYHPSWECALTHLRVRCGDHDGARAGLARVTGADGRLTVWRDQFWLGAMFLTAGTIADLGDPTLAAQLRGMLAPYADQCATLGVLALCLGAVERPLGRLALLLGRPDEAVAHLERAIEMEDRLGAAPWRAWSQAHLADALDARGGAGDAARAVGLRGAAARTARDLGLVALAATLTS